MGGKIPGIRVDGMNVLAVRQAMTMLKDYAPIGGCRAALGKHRMGWRTGWRTGWHSVWRAGWHTGWHTGWLVYGLANWLANWLADLLAGRLCRL